MSYKIYGCWLCSEWIKEKKFMDHLREHDRADHWMGFNPSIEFPKSIEECARRFVPVGLLQIKEVLDADPDEDSLLNTLYG